MYQEVLWRLQGLVEVSQEDSFQNAVVVKEALRERGVSSAKASMNGQVLVSKADYPLAYSIISNANQSR